MTATAPALIEVEAPLRVARNLPIAATSSSVAVSTNHEALSGWSFVETTGTAPAQLQIVDGSLTGGGDIIAEITLNAGQSIRDNTGPYPVECDRGIYINMIAGSVRGAVWSCRLRV